MLTLQEELDKEQQKEDDKQRRYTEKRNDDIRSEIMHQCDGPVTKFVALSRGVSLATSETFTFTADEISNVLYECLEEIDRNGELPSNEFSNASALG